MNTHDGLRSPLAAAIARYVDVKRALGRDFDSVLYRLGQLDRFLAARHATD